ncbi:hypothetical protein CN941_28830 [Bacillus cereus]|nr:hypothetical protein IE3_02864 [Bacillus cereus BAG3X2-1]PFE61894.1 hypothetical protein CN316_25545 [Bacillus cereus]PFL25326.1 hypothetical protein COJ07_01225 [Bacillus cereus]PGL34074.1 hypothetical protein CN930_20180 [Bacillus cereus]PGM28908.1 hypothetical protein CN941_28830 [Bacillus cereus]
MQQWREEKVNPWEDSFVRWLLLLPANEDEHLTQTLEDIAMNRDPILQKAMNKWDCPSCLTHHDRDINASINLKNEAIRLLTARTAEIA